MLCQSSKNAFLSLYWPVWWITQVVRNRTRLSEGEHSGREVVQTWAYVRNFATTYNPCHGLRQLTTMALKTLVKISNVTNLSDARYCAGMGVDMLGFSMDADSPDYIEPKKFAEIRGWVAGVQIVGETQSTDPDVIEQLLEVVPTRLASGRRSGFASLPEYARQVG